MPETEPTPEALKRRQEAQEAAELDALAEADNEESALVHERRADKARYLKAKLDAQASAERGGEP
ncbi:MAG TPA: hypothetical protein VFN55_05225 [Solirubrobacteraceae bacterium]|nr:hypothetical protein [Solirubrobacteraceae bacterium]